VQRSDAHPERSGDPRTDRHLRPSDNADQACCWVDRPGSAGGVDERRGARSLVSEVGIKDRRGGKSTYPDVDEVGDLHAFGSGRNRGTWDGDRKRRITNGDGCALVGAGEYAPRRLETRLVA